MRTAQTITRRRLFKAGLGTLPLAAQNPSGTAVLPFDDARPILNEFAAELPSGLGGAPVTAASWREWEATHDREIRSRLKRGDSDTIVNFVLFGTSFTTRPRVPRVQAEGDQEASALIAARVQDFAAAVVHPGRNERLQFAAEWLKENSAEKRVAAFTLENIQRVLREQTEYARAIADAKQKDAASVFIERSSLYRTRGLSLDTSFRPNYAIERSLAEMKSAGVLRSVQRAAVIGPGLDFTDKRSGYDFYPAQTLQPFALIDSLLRLRLAEAPPVAIFDLSGRVLSHVRGAITGPAYTVQLALDGDTRWVPAAVEYWRTSCWEIGTETAPLRPPPGTEARMRAVRIRPPIVKLLQPYDLDIVIQRLEGPRFDLIVATNILVYYSQFEQALALANIAAMLRPGGILLTNNALPEVAGLPMHPAGATSVAYSEDADDGDHVLWYKRE